MITSEERRSIAREVVNALQQAEYCNTCKMESEQHRADHEMLKEMSPHIQALGEWVTQIKSIKWAVIRFVVIALVLGGFSLLGINLYGGK